MRACPFCNANPTRLCVIDKWLGKGVYRNRVAYVRCLDCNARGPISRGLMYDIRNDRPSMGAAQLLREHAIELWDGATPEPQGEFKLESEVDNARS